MPHSEGAALLMDLQSSNQKYSDKLDECLRQSQDGDDASVSKAGQECLEMLQQQQQVWQQFLGHSQDSADNEVPITETSVTQQTSADPQSKLSRVAAMGGTPALGPGMVLPKLSEHQLHKLASTESRAARELHAAQGRPDEPASTSPEPSVPTPNNSPPWLVELRKRQGNSRPSSPPKQ